MGRGVDIYFRERIHPRQTHSLPKSVTSSRDMSELPRDSGFRRYYYKVSLFSLSVLPAQQLRQSATAKRKVDRIPVKLTIVRGARDEGNVQEQNVTYFDAEGHTIMVTPITGPSWPLSVRLPRLPWSPLHRIEESDAPQSESSSTDSSLQPYRSKNVSFVPADLSLQPYRSANVSFISTDPSLQSYYSANTSFISTDSSLQSYYTANASFITDSSLQSYHTAYASVSSHSTIYSVSTSSHRSDASLPYSVNSANSYKSRKTVLYPRREHPPPVAISSQVRLLLFIHLSQYIFSYRNSPSHHCSSDALTSFDSFLFTLGIH